MRKLLLLLCIAFVVVCYGYPCLILPFGTYEYTSTTGGVTTTSKYTFNFKGEYTYELNGVKSEGFYKLSGNKIIFSDDKTFDDSDVSLKISSMYQLGNMVNKVGMYIAIGFGVLSLLLVLTIPSKK